MNTVESCGQLHAQLIYHRVQQRLPATEIELILSHKVRLCSLQICCACMLLHAGLCLLERLAKGNKASTEGTLPTVSCTWPILAMHWPLPIVPLEQALLSVQNSVNHLGGQCAQATWPQLPFIHHFIQE